ncbi:MAG: HupE/UreJ family protein, partial [Polyangiaceae bacterium]
YTCSHPPKHLTIVPGFLDRFSFTHRHLAEISASGVIEERVAVPANPTIDLDVEAGSTSTSTSTSTIDHRPSTTDHRGSTSTWDTFVPLFKMGILHILTGYDHLAFLFGLVLVGGRKRALIALVTAFTIAHSITLGLAATHTIEPPSSIIEPAIALSIAYVGVENFFVKNAEHRWKITFPFGLIHGFGFAAALQEIALPRAQVPVALFAFNLGVEAGQLAVLAVLLPVLHFARKSAVFRDKGVKGLSVAVTAAGSIWFVLRVASSIHSA